MFIYLLPIAILVLSYLLKIAVKLRLTLPLIYTIAMPTLFHSFYIVHTDLADRQARARGEYEVHL